MFKNLDRRWKKKSKQENVTRAYIVSSKAQHTVKTAAKKSVYFVFLNVAIVWMGSIVYRVLAADYDQHGDLKLNQSLAQLVRMFNLNHTHNACSTHLALNLVEDEYSTLLKFMKNYSHIQREVKQHRNKTELDFDHKMRHAFTCSSLYEMENIHSALHTFSLGITMNLFHPNHFHFHNYHCCFLDILAMHIVQLVFFTMVTSTAFTINCYLTIWLNKYGISEDLKLYTTQSRWFKQRYCLNQITFSSKWQSKPTHIVDLEGNCQENESSVSLEYERRPLRLPRNRDSCTISQGSLEQFQQGSNTNNNPQYTLKTLTDGSVIGLESEQEGYTDINIKHRKTKPKRYRVALSDYSRADTDFHEIPTLPGVESVESQLFPTRGAYKRKSSRRTYRKLTYDRYKTLKIDCLRPFVGASTIDLHQRPGGSNVCLCRRRHGSHGINQRRKGETRRDYLPCQTLSCPDIPDSLEQGHKTYETCRAYCAGSTLMRSLTHPNLIHTINVNKCCSRCTWIIPDKLQPHGSLFFSKRSTIPLHKCPAPSSPSHTRCALLLSHSHYVDSDNLCCSSSVYKPVIQPCHNLASISTTMSSLCQNCYLCSKNRLCARWGSPLDVPSKQCHSHASSSIRDQRRNPQSEGPRSTSPHHFLLSSCKRHTRPHPRSHQSNRYTLPTPDDSMPCAQSGILHKKKVYMKKCLCKHAKTRRGEDTYLECPHFTKQNEKSSLRSFTSSADGRTCYEPDQLVTDCLCVRLPDNTGARTETHDKPNNTSVFNTSDTHIITHLKHCERLNICDKSSNANPRSISETTIHIDQSDIAEEKTSDDSIPQESQSQTSVKRKPIHNPVPVISTTSKKGGCFRGRLKSLKRLKRVRLKMPTCFQLRKNIPPYQSRLSFLPLKRLKALVMMSRNPIGCDTDCFSCCSVCENEAAESRWDVEMLRMFKFRRLEALLALAVFLLYLGVWTATAKYVLKWPQNFTSLRVVHSLVMMVATVSFNFSNASPSMGLHQSLFLIFSITILLVLLFTCLQTTLFKAPPPRLHGRNKVTAEIQRLLEITYRRTYGRAKRLSLDLDV